MKPIKVKTTPVEQWVAQSIKKIQVNADSGVSDTTLYAPNPKQSAFREYQDALNKVLDDSGTDYQYLSMPSHHGFLTKAVSVGNQIQLKIRINS